MKLSTVELINRVALASAFSISALLVLGGSSFAPAEVRGFLLVLFLAFAGIFVASEIISKGSARRK